MKLTNRSEVQPQFDAMLAQEINSYEDLVTWVKSSDTLDAQIGQDYARRYIRQTTNTADEAVKQSYMDFLQNIYPEWIKVSDLMGRKLIASEYVSQLPDEYHNLIRSVRHGVEMFREANIPLISQEKEIESKFAEITGAMTVMYKGEELTMKQAEQYLKSDDRDIRKQIFELMESRRKQNADQLNEVMSDLISIRTQIAHNCGFKSYTDYKFSFRYDYTKAQINEFHESIRTAVSPIVKSLFDKRNTVIKLDDVKPYDFDAPLMPNLQSELFSTTQEMIDKLKWFLTTINPEFSSFIAHLQEIDNLDLETRKNKAPWWYNFPLSGTSDSFIFMNAMRDSYGWFTRAHEAGHGIHHYCTRDLPLESFRDTPSELAEIASMSMELFTIDHLPSLGLSPDQVKDALDDKIVKDISFLPYMSKVDLFQQWMYDHPTHTLDERAAQRQHLNEVYPYALRTGITEARSWQYQPYLDTYRQRQMHFFEVPFYYIEYGIAYLASVQLYNQYVQDPAQWIANYTKILSSWYVYSIPDTMALWWVKFDVSQVKITELLQVMVDKYHQLY